MFGKAWWKETVRQIVTLACTKQTKFSWKGIRRLEFSLFLVNNRQIRWLNRRFRGLNRPTDVLSFPQKSHCPLSRRSGWSCGLGDIMISLDQVAIQAERYGHSLERESRFLLLHGFLHLLGYDHQNPSAEQEMFSLQKEILQSF